MPIFVVDFITVVITTIVFLLILSFLVIIHELGHLLTALYFKVKVNEFGIGYPPRAFTMFKWRGIPFTMNWLPFGGFVQMEGEDGPDTAGEEARAKAAQVSDKQTPIPTPFYTKKKRARLVVLLAGIVMNFVFGVLAFSIVYTAMGIPNIVKSDLPVVIDLVAGGPAQESGLQLGDKIVSIEQIVENNSDKKDVTTSDEVVEYVNTHLGKTLRLTVERSGQIMTFDAYARTLEERPEGQGAIGVAFGAAVEFKRYPWWQMPFRGTWVGLQESVGFSRKILEVLGKIGGDLFTRRTISKEVGSPVKIVEDVYDVGLFKQGWEAVLHFAGILSINLAILNLLPIPALDGGRAMFVILETFIGKRLRERIEAPLNYVFFFLLVSFMLVITARDIINVGTRVLF